jgi:hypothetical protein
MENRHIDFESLNYELFLSAKAARKALLTSMTEWLAGPFRDIQFIFLEDDPQA